MKVDPRCSPQTALRKVLTPGPVNGFAVDVCSNLSNQCGDAVAPGCLGVDVD